MQQYGTKIVYNCALNSIKEFLKHSTKKEVIQRLSYLEINPDWLQEDENYMISVNESSPTTVSMYLRTLRSLFNTAIEDGDIPPDIYPFGKRRYQVPSHRNIKKALSIEDLRPTVVNLTELAEQLIDKRSNEDKSRDSYIFPILDKNSGEAENYRKVKNFTRFINQHLKKLAKVIKITGDISTYYARHSFATLAIRSGASMEFISEALSHRDLKTTQNYIESFPEEYQREIMRKVTEL